MNQPRPLVRCDFGVRAVPWGLFVAPSVAGAFAAMLFVGSCPPVLEGDPEGAYVLGVFFLAVVALAFAVTAVRPLLLAARTRAILDEGGVRLTHKGARAYWGLEVIRRGIIEKRVAYGGPALQLQDRTDRPFLDAPLYGAKPQAQAQQLVAALAERTSAGTTQLDGALAPLRRSGRLVDEWLRDLAHEAQRAAKSSAGFRSHALDVDALLEATEDPRFVADDRAAAAYLLLSTGQPELVDRVRRALSESSPPIMTAVCGAASLEQPVVERKQWSASLAYLDRDDRDAVAALREASPAR